LLATISSLLKSRKKRPIRGKNPTKNKSKLLMQSSNRLRPGLNLLKDQFKNCKKKWTGLKMSWSTRRKSSKPFQMNSTRLSLRCPATRKAFFTLFIPKRQEYKTIAAPNCSLFVRCHLPLNKVSIFGTLYLPPYPLVSSSVITR